MFKLQVDSRKVGVATVPQRPLKYPRPGPDTSKLQVSASMSSISLLPRARLGATHCDGWSEALPVGHLDPPTSMRWVGFVSVTRMRMDASSTARNSFGCAVRLTGSDERAIVFRHTFLNPGKEHNLLGSSDTG